MNQSRFIIGARLASSGERLDLEIRQGKIVAAAEEIKPPEGVEFVDASGKLVVPSACDLHVHLFAPGGSSAENLESAAAAARAGGVSRVLAMPDAPKPVDSASVLRARMDEAESLSDLQVHFAAAMTRGFGGEELTNFYELREMGVRMLCDPGCPVENPAVLRRAMDYARDFDLIFGVSPATPALNPRGCVNEGRISYQLGLPGIPVCGEDMAVTRDVLLAESVGARLHLQSLSSAGALDCVRRAKERGVEVSAQVNVHHLLFDETSVGNYDTNFKLLPPLRLESDREAMVEGLLEGTIDCLVSGHRPCTPFSKAQDFASAADGMTGLQTTLPAVYDRLIRPGKISWSDLVRVYSERPREILGLEPVRIAEGHLAEFFLFDPEGVTEVTAETQFSKSLNTPFLGETLAGAVIAL